MTFASSLLLTLVLSSTTFEARPPVPRSEPLDQECSDSQSCRQLALAAKERKDYDTFHDLAWRAMQKGPKNDPELMLLLARAQSLSGRPGDALVMLQRLTAMGVSTDAATSEDFERVRLLPAWSELEAKMAGKPAPVAPTATTPAPSNTARTESPKPTTEAPPPKAAAPTKAETPAKPETSAKPSAGAKREATVKPEIPPKPDATSTPEPAAPAEGAGRKKESPPDTLTFAAGGMTAAGLAYDAVSGRFLIGDRQEHRLLVVGERSGRLANLAGGDGGFGDVTAFEIDTQEGDLWVTSAPTASQSATVRKLQLISGRVLTSIALGTPHGAARFNDVAVTPQSILILDSEGRRLFRVSKKGKSVELVARLAASVTSLAPASDTSAYAAYDQGLLHIDLATRALTVVEPGADADLSGLSWIRWHRGSIVAVQHAGADAYRLIRIRLETAGRAVRSVDVLADNLHLAGPTSTTISGSTVYYLSLGANQDIEVGKVVLK